MNQTDATVKRRLLFVLGMHRSGTSLTTNVLAELGVSLSEDLMPATHENARGYFESQTISFLQDRILAAFGMQWDTPNSMRALPAQWWESPTIAPLRNQIAAFVRAELEKHPIWGFKDPRTMRLLPMWAGILAELGVEPTFLLVTRNPNEVIGSLFARAKLDPVIGELLWLEHNADALLSCRNNIAAIVDYQGWIDNPLEHGRYLIEKLRLRFDGDDEALKAMLAQVIAPELRHHAGSNEFRLPFTAPLYDALLKRDLNAAINVAGLFNAARLVTSAVTVPLYRKLAEVTNVANQKIARVAELEAQQQQQQNV